MNGLSNWDEIRTAWQVARLGTVSGAAEILGVHHATVIRHIDALEKQLGTRLFQRHARGYTPTEAGRDLLKVADTAADQFSQLAGRLRGQGETVAGELVITSVGGMAKFLIPALASFQVLYPQISIRCLTDHRLFRLEYGEAHVAIRAGNAPDDPDNVVQPFGSLPYALYASRSYVEAHGRPEGPEDYLHHRFIGGEGDQLRAPFFRWMDANVPAQAITFRGTEPAVTAEAIRAGLGIGFCTPSETRREPDLIEILPARPEWAAPLWLVTHVDLHRTAKVQAFLSHLKSCAPEWQDRGKA